MPRASASSEKFAEPKIDLLARDEYAEFTGKIIMIKAHVKQTIILRNIQHLFFITILKIINLMPCVKETRSQKGCLDTIKNCPIVVCALKGPCFLITFIIVKYNTQI